MKKVVLAWSSGKDSAWALYTLRRQPDVEVVGLLTTFNEEFDRVAMHAVRRELVEAQAAAVGLPLHPVMLPWPCSNDEYESRMSAAYERMLKDGVTHVAFGDLFLADIRAYRERHMTGSGLEPLFPIWSSSSETPGLARIMQAAGLKSVIVCTDMRKLPPEFAGREWDSRLLDELPTDVDPCGENGEFHSFCYAGPMFNRPVPIQIGKVVIRGGSGCDAKATFAFADLR